MRRSIKSRTCALAIASTLAAATWAQQPASPSNNLPKGVPANGLTGTAMGYQLGSGASTSGVGSSAAGRFQTATANPANTPSAMPAPASGTTMPVVPQNASAEIPWLRSATEAAMQSQATGKPILVYIRSQNCHYCDLLQKNTWQDQGTRNRVMREMIPLKLTLEENKEAIEAMKVKGFPSVIIFSPRREYLGRIDGYVSPEQFQSQVAKAMLAHQPSNSAPIKR